MVVPASDEILVQKIDSLQMQTGRYCSPFFGIAVLFFNIFFMELTHMWLLSLLSLNSYAPKLNRVVTVVTDLSRFLHYVYTRDGGTLPDQAPDSKSDPPPIDAGSDVPGLAHSTEGLGLCDTAVQVEVCSGRKWVHIHTHTRMHTHAQIFKLNRNLIILEPGRLQHDHPAGSVIAQQYSSATIVSVLSPSQNTNFKTSLKVLWFQFFTVLKLPKSENA